MAADPDTLSVAPARETHVLPAVRAVADEMIALRHAIHARPELAYEELATSDLVAARLAAWGYAVHRGLGGTGVVGTLHLIFQPAEAATARCRTSPPTRWSRPRTWCSRCRRSSRATSTRATPR